MTNPFKKLRRIWSPASTYPGWCSFLNRSPNAPLVMGKSTRAIISMMSSLVSDKATRNFFRMSLLLSISNVELGRYDFDGEDGSVPLFNIPIVDLWQTMRNAHMIVTLQLEPAIQLQLNGWRQAHYPRHANQTPAHLTLFFRLPCWPAAIWKTLEKESTVFPMELQASKLQLNPNGVSLAIDSPPLFAFREQLKMKLLTFLGEKDRKPFHPHITLQQQVTQWKAVRTHEELSTAFNSFAFQATGLDCWQLDKQGWIFLKSYPAPELIN